MNHLITGKPVENLRVAIVHDWLLGMRGGEHCLKVLCGMFTDPEIYTFFYDSSKISPLINSHNVSVSNLGKLPQVSRYYRWLLPLYPIAAKSLGEKLLHAHQLEPYDLVISISHCGAKNVIVPPGVVHICYCLTPVRYLWDQYDSYFSGRLIEPFVRQVAKGLRRWDVEGSRRVDLFLGISEFIKERIAKVYGRDSYVVYPPVDTSWLVPRKRDEIGDGFLSVNALVPYKNLHIIVEAFNRLGLKLTIVGTGPELRRLKQISGDNIEFVGNVSGEALAELYNRSKALIFAAVEDFGMAPVEMQASGRPVIALAQGGALETVSLAHGRQSGVLYYDLSVASLCKAVEYFLDRESEFTVDNCIKQGNRFSMERFCEDFVRETLASLGESCGVETALMYRRV